MTIITIENVAAMGCGKCDHYDSGWVGAMEVRAPSCAGGPGGVRISPVLARTDESRCGMGCRWAKWSAGQNLVKAAKL